MFFLIIAFVVVKCNNNGRTNHLYDITNKNEDALNNNVDPRPVGNEVKNASSTSIIPPKKKKVNTSAKKASKNKKALVIDQSVESAINTGKLTRAQKKDIAKLRLLAESLDSVTIAVRESN